MTTIIPIFRPVIVHKYGKIQITIRESTYATGHADYITSFGIVAETSNVCPWRGRQAISNLLCLSENPNLASEHLHPTQATSIPSSGQKMKICFQCDPAAYQVLLLKSEKGKRSRIHIGQPSSQQFHLVFQQLGKCYKPGMDQNFNSLCSSLTLSSINKRLNTHSVMVLHQNNYLSCNLDNKLSCRAKNQGIYWRHSMIGIALHSIQD